MVLSEYSVGDDRCAFKSAPSGWVRGARRSCSQSDIERWCGVKLEEVGIVVVERRVWQRMGYGRGKKIIRDSEMGDCRLKI